MECNKFLAATLEEYKSLLLLKKHLIKEVYVSFQGQSNQSEIEPINVIWENELAFDKQAQQQIRSLEEVQKALKITQEYLYRNLEYFRPPFSGLGCEGEIRIILTGKQPVGKYAALIRTVIPGPDLSDVIRPQTEIEALAAECLIQ
jgi:hypothetical protein